MQNDEKKKKPRTDEEMLKKILLTECGDADEFAADELELGGEYYGEGEFAEDGNPPIGESEYFSTCEYTMIPTDDDSVNCQGS